MKKALLLSSLMVVLLVAGCAVTAEGRKTFLGMSLPEWGAKAKTTTEAVAPLLPPPWGSLLMGLGGIAATLTGAKGISMAVKKVKDSESGKIV